MPTQKPTPEEKLFAVIQGAQQKPLRRRPQALTLAQAGSRVTSMVAAVDLPQANQALTGGVIVLALLCLLNPLMMRPQVDRLLNKIEPGRASIIPAPLEGLKPLETYLETMARQNPFGIGEQPLAATSSAAPVAQAPVDPNTLLGDAKLVGISLGEVPTAMVEQQKQTYFLTIGDMLGPLKVKEILSDRVIFDADGKPVELF